MFKKIKRLVKKLLFSHRADSESYIQYLRNGGAEIGERVNIFDPGSTVIDATRPWMIKIGNDVQITSGVTILTHGYDWSVLKGEYGPVLGSAGEVVIGNNVFIGMHTTILKGVRIGDNCIIGANSLVNRDIAPGWVAAGNPAKPIMRVEDYLKKRQDAQLKEAEELYACYVKRMGKEPPVAVFDEFFWLFEKRYEAALTAGQRAKMKQLGNYDTSLQLFLKTPPAFEDYEAFLTHMRHCIRKGN